MNQRPGPEDGQQAQAYAQQRIQDRRCRVPAAQQVIGLQREGGKCGKPAAKPHLQKQQQRLGIDFMPFTQCGQQPNSKGAQHIDEQGDNGEGRLAHRDQSKQIAQYCTHKAAQTYKKYVYHGRSPLLFFSWRTSLRISFFRCRRRLNNRTR